jgi:hypothetical protein
MQLMVCVVPIGPYNIGDVLSITSDTFDPAVLTSVCCVVVSTDNSIIQSTLEALLYQPLYTPPVTTFRKFNFNLTLLGLSVANLGSVTTLPSATIIAAIKQVY